MNGGPFAHPPPPSPTPPAITPPLSSVAAASKVLRSFSDESCEAICYEAAMVRIKEEKKGVAVEWGSLLQSLMSFRAFI